MIGSARTAFLFLSLAGLTAITPSFCQTPATPKPGDHSASYYAFAMAHLNGELASAYGNRGEYVNKAIDFYKQAIRLDPEATYISEELADFYIQVGQIERALQQANDLIKADPTNSNAHKILARIYARQIGDPDQGQGKIDQAMLKNAVAEYQKVTELNPKDTESMSMLARLYRVQRDEANAEKTYRALLAADPNDDEALTGLASVFADRGDMANAIAMLKQAAEKNPDPRTVTTLAEFYEQDKQFANAADTWKQALPITNDNIEVRKRFAVDSLAAERWADALKAFEGLAAEDPKNVEIQLQLVELYERKQDFPAAHAALAKAQAVSSAPQIKIAEAELLSSEGKNAQAITVLEELLAKGKKATYTDQEKAQQINVLEMLGQLQRKADKTQDALASFRQIAELNPAVASRVEIQVVATLAEGKDYKGARAAADAAVKKFPGDRLVMLEHASLLGELGQVDAAINEFKALPDSSKDREILTRIAQLQDKAKRFADERKTLDAIEAISSTDQEKLDLTFKRGAMYEREKNFDAAEQQFKKVLSTDPNNAEALNYFGYMLADRGVRLDEAQQLISKALDIQPGNGAFLDSLGWVHFHQNHLDQAADELRQALDKIGKDPTVHDHLGEVYFKQGKIREAIQQWEASVAEMKTAAPSEQDPEELSKITRKLESAKVRVAEKK